ncbi:MAG: pantetheine-phosphate adenylyltransferase [Chloroflexi bacterium RBG_16_57_9]|nr:MAG: pantetheine-phosphate adenylyltransferase [Chloroflexi bacterium RBG_16_57_9]
MTVAVYPATFDPITNGHVDIATRAAGIFEQLIVAVYDRPSKNLLFSPEERWQMTQQALAHLPNVTVERYNGMTVAFAQEVNARAIVRGLRVVSDFEWEFQLALTNRQIAPEIDTVCLMASQQYSFLSSSLIKEIAMLGGPLNGMVPDDVVIALQKKMQELKGGDSSKIKVVSLRGE